VAVENCARNSSSVRPTALASWASDGSARWPARAPSQGGQQFLLPALTDIQAEHNFEEVRDSAPTEPAASEQEHGLFLVVLVWRRGLPLNQFLKSVARLGRQPVFAHEMAGEGGQPQA
jgi:hypothetical protein